MTTTLTKNQIKAIRIVMGFNPDLRVNLRVNEEPIWSFIDNNRFGILGVEFGFSRPEDVTTSEWDEYERTLYKMANQVIEGR